MNARQAKSWGCVKTLGLKRWAYAGNARRPIARATKITFLGDLEERLMMNRASDNGRD